MRKHLFSISSALVFMLLSSLAIAQSNSDAISKALDICDVTVEELRSIAPHFPDVSTGTTDPVQQVQQFIDKYPGEWNAVKSFEKIRKQNISWTSLGLNEGEQESFKNSFWEWYKSSGISEERTAQLFPHFPKPNLSNDPSLETDAYSGELGMWMRLYPIEYETFLNTPELTALNPGYSELIEFKIMPVFLGADIGSQKPQQPGDNASIEDRFSYERQIRNWYFIYKPSQFEKLYGADFRFDQEFDTDKYRDEYKTVIAERESVR